MYNAYICDFSKACYWVIVNTVSIQSEYTLSYFQNHNYEFETHFWLKHYWMLACEYLDIVLSIEKIYLCNIYV